MPTLLAATSHMSACSSSALRQMHKEHCMSRDAKAITNDAHFSILDKMGGTEIKAAKAHWRIKHKSFV